MSDMILDKLYSVVGKENVLIDEPMSKHTTFKVGGPADYYITPNGIEEAAEIVRLLLSEKIPFYIVGNGSNLLVRDEGFRGCIVSISKGMDEVRIEGNVIHAQAGAMLSRVANVALENGLDGMTFASGIPGTVGGAMVMNAGAYGSEMKNIVRDVTLLDMETAQIVTLPCDKMEFCYRGSIIKRHPYLVLSAAFTLAEGDKETIRAQMAELAEKRRSKQPLEFPSAGSTFKRPEGYFAGKLIEDAGLKGYSVGGAMVSDKHCGFVINKGNATAADILTLIGDVRSKVKECFGVELEPEVCILPVNI